MATADSVKTKLQGLIDTANATTGKEDATLTAAVSSLVDGFGSGGGNAEAFLAMLNGMDIPDNGGTLRIPEGVTRVPNYFYNNLSSIKNLTVILPESVTSIESYGFHNIGNMAAGQGTRFLFNDTVEQIKAYAFNGARYCKIEGIPKTVKTVGERAFTVAQTLASAYSDDLLFPNVETIGKEAFSNFNFAGANVHLGSGISAIGVNAFAFKDAPSFTLTIDRAEDAISGAPWGATNATIVWTGGDA